MFAYPTYTRPKAKCWICQKEITANVSVAWGVSEGYRVIFECCGRKEEKILTEKEIEEINKIGFWMAFLQ